jgi:hypothetical protein
MVFELCEKGTVLNISMDNQVDPLPIPLVRNYFQQLILGIEYRTFHFSTNLSDTIHSLISS